MYTMDNIETWSQRSDVEFDHKRAKEVLRDAVVLPVEELVGCEILRNPRVVLFGSSVSELKAPKDLDAMLIYDAFDSFEFDTNLLSGVGEKMGVAIRAYEAELESDGLITSGHVHIAGVDMPIIRSDQFAKLFDCNNADENRHSSLDRMARVFERVELLAEKIKTNKETDLDHSEIDSWAEIARGIPCLLLRTNGIGGEEYVSQLNSYRNIARRAMGIPEVIITEDEARRLEKEYLDNTVKLLLKINPDLGKAGQSLLDTETTNWTGLEAKEFLADLVRFCTARVETISKQEDLEEAGYVISKGIRQLVTTFNLGVNFVQSSIRSGAVQIMGDPVSDLSESATMPYDSALLKKDHTVRIEPVNGEEDFTDFYNVVIQNPYFDHDTCSRIVEVFGKENCLRYMLHESFGPSDLENIWSAISYLIDPDKDWPVLVNLMSDERIMSVEHSSVRMALLKKMTEVSNPEELLDKVPSNLFMSTLVLLTGRSTELGNILDHYEMILKDIDLLLSVCKRAGLDLSVPEEASYGRFDPKFLQGYVQLMQTEDCSGWPMAARARHVESNNECGMLTDSSVNELESIPDWDGDDSWAITSRHSNTSESTSVNGALDQDSTLDYSFYGTGLRLEALQVGGLVESLLNGHRKELDMIIGGNVKVIGKVDFTPQKRQSFKWDSMTDSLLTGYRDIRFLLKDLEENKIDLTWVGGLTNPQMASMAHRMGFQHIFLRHDGQLYPMSSRQLRDLANARLASGSVKELAVEKIGIEAISSVDDLEEAYVVVLGNVQSIRERVDKLEQSGLAERLEQRHAVNPGSSSGSDSY